MVMLFKGHSKSGGRRAFCWPDSAAKLLLLCAACCLLACPNLCAQCLAEPENQYVEPFETITYKDPNGTEHEELAFREPHRGLPNQLLEVFCSSIKMRLYWGIFREEVKSTRRKGLYLRRMARLARHIFPDIRDADKPFNETMLSRPDEYFSAPLVSTKTDDSSRVDKALDKAERASQEAQSPDDARSNGDKKKVLQKIKSKVVRIKKSLSSENLKNLGDESGSEQIDEIESGEPMRELGRQGLDDSKTKIKEFLRYWAPKVALGVYTRWRTMWWLMMSCLFTKYYLWDPALDEFMKLQRNLVMWPELQLAKMHELDCKPLMLFRRILDTCKILNPLMKIDFGQFSLDKLTRFKSDINR